jgi:exodeoxyribonuclease V beta subunit
MTERRVARPAILRAIPPDRSAVIEASAGTGKTYTIEHVVVDLLLRTDATLDSILVVTFTEKATHELALRLRAKLEELRFGEGDLPSLGGPTPTPTSTEAGDHWVIDDAARAKLEVALNSFDGASVTTIHAFCQRVLRDNAFASGRMFDEQQVDGRDAFARALRDALRRDVAGHEGRAAWLEAGLRSGYSIDGIEELLWGCLQSRGDLLPLLDEDAIRRTLDAFPIEDARSPALMAQLRRWGMQAKTAQKMAAGLVELADIVARARVSGGAISYVVDANLHDPDFKYLLEKLPEGPSDSGARLRAAVQNLARVPTLPSALAQVILPPVLDVLRRRKRDAGQYDFDDMLGLVDQTLRGPRAQSLATSLRGRWRHVLIDESQDTDETQWSIFRRGFLVPPGPTTLYLVGDPKQSIYRFRGADIHTYLRARAEIIASGGQPVTLDCNYRSTPSLVAAYNAIFDQQATTPVFTGSLEHLPVACGRPDSVLVDGDGRPVTPVHVWRFSQAPDMSAVSALGERMAAEIRRITDPERPWRLDGRALGPSDVYVLTRTAREGRAIGEALRASRVPHAYYKEDGLFQTDEARELHTLLLAIEDPNDRSRRLAAWLTPFFGLSLAAIERARDLTSSHSLVARLHAWKVLADRRDFDALFESIVEHSGVVRREIFFADGERELTNTQQIVELVVEHAHRTRATLRDLVYALGGFIDRKRLPLEVEGNVQRLESERRAVQIMTIHKSKGLEAPIVLAAGGFTRARGDDVHVFHQDGRRRAWVGRIGDPQVKQSVAEEEGEEEQRLMYVALTRARGRLYLPCAVRDGGDKPAGMVGPYRIINRRIAELLQSNESRLFSVEDLPAPSTAGATVDSRARAVAWMPPVAWLSPERTDEKYSRLSRQRAGAFVTSYTRMKSELEGLALVPRTRPNKGTDAPATALRGARTSGIFLHDLLERVPLGSFGASTGFEAWRLRPEVAALFADAVVAHRIDPVQREHAERLVWAAFTTPLRVSGEEPLHGIAAAARVVREMDFVFAIADGATVPPPLSRVRGYVRGSIDVAFEHAGRTYFVDWKSDSLASYSSASLDRHVHDNYRSQAQLYAMAIVKLLGVETKEQYEAHFGGMFYAFLRGLEAGGEGVWSERPPWESVSAWQAALAEPGFGRRERLS